MSSAAIAESSLPAAPTAARSPVVIEDRATVPAWVGDLDSFRRWARSDEFPERGRFAYLDGSIWVDLSMEQLFTHGCVKAEVTAVIRNVNALDRRGYLFPDGALYTNPAANLSTVADALFVLKDSVKNGRARLIEGAQGGYIELEGSADLVAEVISPTTQRKDTEVLRELYWKAGVTEYWLVDCRGEIDFRVLNRGDKGYEEQPVEDGWVYSTVLDRRLRLLSEADELGNPEFSLLDEAVDS